MSAFVASPGLWPREFPRETKSDAERKVYEALRPSLPKNWYTWHSLKLRTKARGEFTEADFVIADPNRPSILVLEVKGGQIAQRNGRWYQNGWCMKASPFDQAFGFLNKLLDRFRECKVNAPTIGIAVCYPDTFFQEQPTQDDVRDLVIGEQDLPFLDRILKEVMARAVPNPRPVKGGWISLLHEFWGETWVPRLSLGTKISSDAERRIKLDEEQLERLDEIEENDRVLISGAAGTGKTLFACEAALRCAKQGKRVLLLCFTDALGVYLADKIKHPNVSALAVRHFAAQLLGDDVTKNLGSDPSDYWNNVSLRAAVDGLPPENERWDCVIIDEGQDFSGEDWDLILECNRKTGRLWVFADENQAFWSDRKIPESIERESFRIKLRKPYRCSPAIQNLSDCYARHHQPDFQLLEEAVRDDTIRVVTCSEQGLTKQVGKEINRLLGDGLQPSEIAVISVRGRNIKENIYHNKELGGNRIVPATDKLADSRIVCDTFLRFKGLERPAIIITDLRLVSEPHEMRMHMAVSRALNLLRVVGVEKELRKDAVLAKLI